MQNWWKKYYPLSLILILGSILRIRLLTIRGTFWFDEMFSIHFSSLSWSETLRYAVIETNPPLYTFFMRAWLFLTNSANEIIIRFPSMIFGLLTIILIYILAEKMLSRRAAIASSLFLSIADLHIFLNTEARSYSLLVMLTALSFFCFYQLFFSQNPKYKIYWPVYMTTNLFLVFTHLTALSVPTAQMLALVLINPEKKKQIIWWWSHIIIGLMWLAWFIPSFIGKMDSRSLTAWYFDPTTSQRANILTLAIGQFFTNHYPIVFTSLSLLISTMIIMAIIKYWKKETIEKKKQIIMLLLWSFLLIVAGSLLGVYISKFYVTSALGLFLLTSYAIDKLMTTKTSFFLTMLFLFLLIFPSTYGVINQKIFSWHDLTKPIEERETEHSITALIPFHEILPFQRYYSGHQPVKGIYVYDDNLSFEERTVRFNWNKQITDKEKLKQWLAENTKGVDKFFYIQYTDEYDWVQEIMLENNWTIFDTIPAKGYVKLYLFEFHAPNYNPSDNKTNS